MTFKETDGQIQDLEKNAEGTVEPLPWVFVGEGHKLAEVSLKHDRTNRFSAPVDIRVKVHYYRHAWPPRGSCQRPPEMRGKGPDHEHEQDVEKSSRRARA